MFKNFRIFKIVLKFCRILKWIKLESHSCLILCPLSKIKVLFRVIGSICNQKFIESLYKVWLCLEINWVILCLVNQESLPWTRRQEGTSRPLEIEDCNLDIGIIKIYTRCFPWCRTGHRVTPNQYKIQCVLSFYCFLFTFYICVWFCECSVIKFCICLYHNF